MKRKFLQIMRLAALSVISLIFFSCATTVDVRLTRPAQLDLNGARTIAVLPFKPCAYYREYDTSLGTEILINSFYQIFNIDDPDESELLELLQSRIQRGLLDSPYINVVSSNEVIRAQKNGQLNPADVYLTGEMASFKVRNSSYEEKKVLKEAEGNRKEEYEIITYWQRTVEFTFRYQVVDSSDNQIISYREIHDKSTSDSYQRKSELPSPYDIAKSDFVSASKTILKQLQPYAVIKTIELLEYKTKDKGLKERFKAANKLASDGALRDSVSAFTELYKETDIAEAGYNAAILTEALGNLSEAERMMLEVYDRYPDSRVAGGLSDIRYEIQQANRLQKQINDSKANEEDQTVDF